MADGGAHSGGELADDAGSGEEGERAHRARREMVKLKVALAWRGALGAAGNSSPEFAMASGGSV